MGVILQFHAQMKVSMRINLHFLSESSLILGAFQYFPCVISGIQPLCKEIPHIGGEEMALVNRIQPKWWSLCILLNIISPNPYPKS
jgi:hypothetical protein